MTLNMNPRVEEGSFADRRKKLLSQPLQLLKVLKEQVDGIAVTWPFCEDVKHIEFPICVDGLKQQIVQPVQTVQSSKLYLGRLLRIRNQVCEMARRYLYLIHSSQTDPRGTLSLQNDIPCKNRIGSQHLDQGS
jgi:hypothetical protein